jgi:hypothetical protein
MVEAARPPLQVQRRPLATALVRRPRDGPRDRGAPLWPQALQPGVIAGAERDRLWHRFVEMYPQAAQYTRFTDRNFSLIALEPV